MRDRATPLRLESLEDRRLLAVGFDWAFALASNVAASGNYTSVSDVAIDTSGNAYVFGGNQVNSGTVDFDPGTTSTSSSVARGAFVAKYGPDKGLQWVKEFPAIHSSGRIAVDDGGVYVTGTIEGDLSVDGHTRYATHLLGIYNDAQGHAFVQDGDQLTITNRLGIPTVFEYDRDGSPSVPERVFIRVAQSDSNVDVVTKTIDAINDANVGVAAIQHPSTNWGFTVNYSNQITLKDQDDNTPALMTPDGGPDNPRYWWSRQADVFAAKLDSATGAVGWTYKSDWASFPGTLGLDDSYRRAFDITVSNGAVYLAGTFIRHIDLNGTAPGGILAAAQNSAGDEIQDGYVLQLSAGNGTFTDARQLQLPNSWHVTVFGLAADANSLYVSGEFNGSGLWKLQRSTDLGVNLENGTWSANVPNPAVFTGGIEVQSRAVAVAPNGDLLVTGRFEKAVDFNPDTTKTTNLTSTKAAKGTSYSGYSDDVFVVRLANNGTLKWAKSFGGAHNDQAFDVTTDGNGNVYTTGYFIRSADFDPGRGTYTLKAQGTNGNFEAFVSKLDANGNFVWAGNMGGTANFLNSDDEGHGIAVDDVGNIYVAGQFRGSGDFDPTSGTFTLSTGANEVLGGFLQKLTQASPLQADAMGSGDGINNAQSNLGEILSWDAQAVVQEAVRHWQRSGVHVDGLLDVDIRVAQLGGTTLGLAYGSTIWLDDDAAGWGWFVDATPQDDREFLRGGNQGEQDRMDLLTVVMHELGHLLGYDHADDGVMVEALAAGTRYQGTTDDRVASVDDIFRQADTEYSARWLGAWSSAQVESQHPWARRRR